MAAFIERGIEIAVIIYFSGQRIRVKTIQSLTCFRSISEKLLPSFRPRNISWRETRVMCRNRKHAIRDQLLREGAKGKRQNRHGGAEIGEIAAGHVSVGSQLKGIIERDAPPWRGYQKNQTSPSTTGSSVRSRQIFQTTGIFLRLVGAREPKPCLLTEGGTNRQHKAYSVEGRNTSNDTVQGEPARETQLIYTYPLVLLQDEDYG